MIILEANQINIQGKATLTGFELLAEFHDQVPRCYVTNECLIKWRFLVISRQVKENAPNNFSRLIIKVFHSHLSSPPEIQLSPLIYTLLRLHSLGL